MANSQEISVKYSSDAITYYTCEEHPRKIRESTIIFK